MKSFLLVACATIGLTLFSSCGSPAGEGGDYATKENNLYKEIEQKLNNLNKELSTDINAGKYASRTEAKEAWLARHRELFGQFEQGTQDIAQELEELEGSMESDKYSELEDAYENGLDVDMRQKLWTRLNDTVLPPDVLKSISKIIPVKPDEKQIQKDLAHSTFTGAVGDYFYENHREIKVDEYDITNLHVIEVEKDNDGEYIVKVSLRLVGKVNRDRQIDVNCKLRYILPQYDDWTIDFFQTESLTPVKTDIYNNCVRLVNTSGFSGGLRVENNCNIPLEVYVRFNAYGHWEQKIVRAEPQAMSHVDYSTPSAKEIEFILPL